MFSLSKESLVYEGPLPKTCSCKSAHLPMVGVSTDQKFCSSDGLLLGVLFWRRIFPAVKSDAAPVAVTDRERTSLYGAWRSASQRACFWNFPGVNGSVLIALRDRKVTSGGFRGPSFSLCKVSTYVSYPHRSGSSTTTASARTSGGGAPGTVLRSAGCPGGTAGLWLGTGLGQLELRQVHLHARAPDCFAVEGRRWQWVLARCSLWSFTARRG